MICHFIPRIAFAILFSATTQALLAQGYSPELAASKMQVASGFEVQIVAAEPLVRQPVAIEFDDRGRLWVVQYLQYPNPEGLKRVTVDRFSRTKYDRVPEPPPKGPKGADRITILEDTNGDGRMDRSKDFVTGLNLTSGIAFGHGGVFVLNVPYLLFYPDKNRDDVPDSDPEVLLTGFGMEDAHSVANSLTWGPDGWLYGCQGSTVTANIRGIEFQQGVWRYHPVTRKFELFCEGGGNSWGLDFDARGRLFYSTNWGGNILLHAVQGGYYIKSFGKHGELHNPYAYGYFDHAPHRNFTGGHVTVGGLVYQGGAFPEKYNGRYIAGDLLGHGVNWHSIENVGSTVRTSHGGSLVDARDNWFAPTDVTTGPDGAIYFSDWHDARTAHPDPDADWDRTNGRIYRLKAKGASNVKTPDFASLSDEALMQLHLHPNQWQVRRARQELVRRYLNSAGDGGMTERLEKLKGDLLAKARNLQNEMSLESFWTLACLGSFNEEIAFPLLDSPHAGIRYWAVRLIGDRGEISEKMAHRLDEFAEQEPDVWVRGQVASSAARLPAKYAVPMINANINRDIDNGDPFLPLQWWWAVERHSVSGREEVIKRFIRPSLWKSKMGSQFLLPRLVRRYAAEGTTDGLGSVVRLLESAPTTQNRQTLWQPVLLGLQEVKKTPVEMQSWRNELKNHKLSNLVKNEWLKNRDDPALIAVGLVSGIAEPLEYVKLKAFSADTERDLVLKNLNLLKYATASGLTKPLLALFEKTNDNEIRKAIIDLLGRVESSSAAQQLIKFYQKNPQIDTKLKSQIRDVLLARPGSAGMWLTAVENKETAASETPVDQIRRIALFNDKAMNAIVTKHWGRLEAASREEKLAEVRRLNNDVRAFAGNATEGRNVFQKNCANCHQLFGEGAKVGPDLTSANRRDRDFLLVSLVDPSSVVRKEYVSLVVYTKAGQVLTGLPVSRDDNGLKLVDAKGQTTIIPQGEIEEIQESTVSLMPEDLYRQLSPQQLRDLFAYLQSNESPKK